jgi:uncharacterized sodium:solute symporter family permease YidK
MQRTDLTIEAIRTGRGLEVLFAVFPDSFIGLFRGELALRELLRIEYAESLESRASVFHVVVELGVARLSRKTVGSLAMAIAQVVRDAGLVELVGLAIVVLADDEDGGGDRTAQRLRTAATRCR